MRSTQEGELSPAETGAAPENLPVMKSEAKDSESLLEKAISVETELSSEVFGTWSTMALVSENQTSVTRAEKAQAWETQAFGAQCKISQTKRNFMELTTASDMKHKPSVGKQIIKNEESDVLLSRPLWPSKIKYILTHLGYSLKPVTFWQFVFLWLRNGGCSFLIIYIVMLFLVGIPLLFLEMAVGQKLNQHSIGLWKIIGPWAGGVGYTIFMMCFITSTYLNVYNSWIIFSVSQSFQAHVPWEKCPLMKNSSDFDPECARTTPSMYFWYRQMLKASDRIEDSGPPVLGLSLPFFLSWCLVGAFVINGLKSTGKVMYVLVPFPYFIILCFFIRSLLLEGAIYGLQYLLFIKMSTMYSMSTWSIAGIQVLLDLGLGFGPIVSLSSYMPRSNNCLSDAFVLVLIKMVTLLFTTPCVLCILGFWATAITHRCSEKNAETLVNLMNRGMLPPDAHPPINLHENPSSIYNTWLNNLPQHVKDMVLRKVPECTIQSQFLKIKEGTHFVVPTFLEVTSVLPGSAFWSIFFFLMLLTLGLSTSVGLIHSIITSLQDTFSSLRKQPKLLTVGISLLMFLCGLFFTRPSGTYFIRLLSEYCIILPIIFILICENIAVAWAYGAKRFLEDLTDLLGRPISPIYGWLWCFVSPLVLLVLFAAIVFQLCMKPLVYTAWDSSSSKHVLRHYPPWGLFLTIMFIVIVIFPTPAYFVYCFTHGIPFRPNSKIRPIPFSKSLNLSNQQTPSKEVPKEEILQVDKQIAEQPVT